MREVINQIRTNPDRRHPIISHLYRLHCDGILLLLTYASTFFVCFIGVEVVLGKNEEMLHIMIESGILEILVDIMSSDSDPDTLV